MDVWDSRELTEWGNLEIGELNWIEGINYW